MALNLRDTKKTPCLSEVPVGRFGAERKDGWGLHVTGAAAALQRHEFAHRARLGAADLVGLPHRSQVLPPVPPQCGDRQRAGVRDTPPATTRTRRALTRTRARLRVGAASAVVGAGGQWRKLHRAWRSPVKGSGFLGFSVYGCSPWLRPAPARVAGCAAADFAHDRNRARHALRRNVDAMAHQHAAAAAARPPHLMRHRRNSAAGVLLMLVWLLMLGGACCLPLVMPPPAVGGGNLPVCVTVITSRLALL